MRGRHLVAWNLRQIRVRSGLSQDQLAADAKVDRAYVGSLERGTANPTVDLLDRVADALEVSLGELFRRPRPGSKPPEPLKRGRKPA